MKLLNDRAARARPAREAKHRATPDSRSSGRERAKPSQPVTSETYEPPTPISQTFAAMDRALPPRLAG